MAQAGELTVRDLLPAHFHDLDGVVRKALRQDAALVEAHLPKALGGVVADRVAGAVTGAMNLDVIALLANAWAKARELHAYAKTGAEHDPAEEATLFLGEHELAVELHPLAKLSFAGVSHLSLRFTLQLAAKIRAAQLTIKNGHIVEIGKCDGSVSAQLKYGSVPLHNKLKPKDLTLIGGRVLADPGVRIP